MTNIKPLKSPSSFTPTMAPQKTKLRLSCASRVYIISKSDILYLKADSNYCEVHLVDGRTIICSQTLKLITSKLASVQFFRPHQSYVFNMKFLESVCSTMSELHLEGGISIPVSRRKRNELKEMLDRWYD